MLSLVEFRSRTAPEEWQAGESLLRSGEVRELHRGEQHAEYIVHDEPYRLVRLRAAAGSRCDCGLPHCRHQAAARMLAEQSGAADELRRQETAFLSHALYEAVDSYIPQSPRLKLEASLHLQEDSPRLGLRVGEERLYVVKNLPVFLRALDKDEEMALAPGLGIRPSLRDFSAQDAVLLRLMKQYLEATDLAQKKWGQKDARQMPLPPETFLRTLRALSVLRFRLTDEEGTRMQSGIAQTGFPAVFHVSGGRRDIVIRAQMDSPCRLVDQEGSHILMKGQLCRLHRLDRPLARVLLSREEPLFVFPQEELRRVTAELLPTLMQRHAVVLEEELERRLIRLPMQAVIYLDRAGEDIIAKLRFQYGEYEIDPFSLEETPQLLLHDAQRERLVLEAMAEAGFRVRKGFVILTGEERIYRFLTEKMQTLHQVALLYLSQSFKRLSPRSARLSGKLSASSSGISLTMMDDGQPVEDLLPLLQAIQERKRYFRYKDGSFITLEGSEAWRDLAEAALEAALEQHDTMSLRNYRAAYLKALAEQSEANIQVDASVREALTPPAPLPSPVEGLHPYQERGFQWLYGLYRMGMGGILADEMGLGKTVQTIAAILQAVRTEHERRPSIIVVPTTLCYNWLSEFRRFAPELHVRIIEGSQPKREEAIAAFTKANAPDVLITSYPLIRQDIDLLRDIPFRFAVLDEAQFIKNSLSLSARACKRLEAQARFALSGTPMENNAAELWSLFDFVLPGYLPPLRGFLRRYDQGRRAQELLMRIRPFLMRRLKSQVMAELPPKIETMLSVPMPEDQRRVYRAVLNQRRIRLESMLEHSSPLRTQGEVLAALTQLRQICCHPQLVMPSFNGDSGKLQLLMDILPEAIEGGHRLLIFSQFTRMLKIIRRQLEQAGMPCLYLDGETKPQERQALSERFNRGNEPIFLISLKAGGTGLNLTGADMVIHFDPWWNPSAEDQAADRAHRLGQDKPVQVLRLVMQGSIEDKVLELGRNKRKLFEKLVTPGESMPDKLKPEDILKLFSEGEG